MEQNVDTGVPIAPVTENNKQNGGNGLKIATAIACIVAVCGIGFGVYSMMQSSQKDNQVSDLQNQINTLNDELSSKKIARQTKRQVAHLPQITIQKIIFILENGT